jgi:protein-tyrosine phosphatase
VETAPSAERQRHLTLAGTYNVRDVGGYATTDGRTTRWRTLLRADSLHRLAPDGQQALLDLGLRTIVDLRRPGEVARYPNTLATAPALRYLQVSLNNDAPEARAKFPTLPEVYRGILDTAAAQLGTIVATLAAPGALPGLIHCQAGKDRTGIVIALLLGAVGVPHETIVADYARSADHLAGEFTERSRRRAIADGVDWGQYQQLLLSPAEFMIDVLASLDEAHGGVRGYLRDAGVRDEQFGALKSALTE